MKIPKRSEMVASQIAGKNAKVAGHEFEHKLAVKAVYLGFPVYPSTCAPTQGPSIIPKPA